MGIHRAVHQRWSSVLETWRSSGLCAAAFCRREQISRRSFYKWRKRLAEDAPSSSEPAADFVPMRFAARDSGRNCGIAVVVGAGLRLELSPGFDADELVRAVRALGGGSTC
jgi:transposase